MKLLYLIIIILLFCAFVLLIVNYIKKHKSKKYFFYLYLNDIFEKNSINLNSEFYDYSKKFGFIKKYRKQYRLTNCGLEYIKNYNDNIIILLIASLSFILSILSYIKQLL